MALEIAAGDYRLIAAPARGGSILSFTWRGQPVMRETEGEDILDVACFPLVPYSNRIAGGRFPWRGREVVVPVNWPAVDPRNPIHGYGWLSAWEVAAASADRLRLIHDHDGAAWPWPYRAELLYALGEAGLTVRLALTNTGSEPMPAGLGFHPYFPRDAQTRYIGLHRGEWQRGDDPLPTVLDQRAEAADWWDGEPVGARVLDTVFAGREGPLRIVWPERGMAVTIAPSPALGHTAVYVPGDADWFCVEPVSHLTDALNGRDPEAPMAALEPGDTIAAEMHLGAEPL